MASYGPPPASFGAPPGYQNYMGAPGVGPASATAGAPGMAPPPGVSAQSPVNGNAPFNPANFQLPAGINPHASVIRLGPQSGKPGLGAGRDVSMGNRGRMGLGAEGGRPREAPVHQLTKEEVSRSIYIGGLVEGMPNEALVEAICNIGSGLVRWTRVTNAEGKPLDFGFAEYEDAASLQVATKLLEDLDVPLKKDGEFVRDEEGDIVMGKFIVIIDPQSVEYINQWINDQKKDEISFKIDAAQDDLDSLLTGYKNGTLHVGDENGLNGDGIMANYANQAQEQAELLALPSADDELSDIPADQREMVAAEIAAFRDRSNKRDLERLKMEEDMERSITGRVRGAASPTPAQRVLDVPVNAPSGPRGATVPTGPKSYRGLQIPKDHIDGIDFVNGKADDVDVMDDDLSDGEMERQRQKKRDDELEKTYLEQERKWLTKERAHFAAVERQEQDETREAAKREQHRQELATKLEEFDDEEGAGKRHIFYTDRRAWRSARRGLRKEEQRADTYDRREEDQQKQWERQQERAREQRDRRPSLHSQRNGSPPARPESSYGGDDAFARRVARTAAPVKASFTLAMGGKGDDRAVKREEAIEEKPALTTMAAMENLLDDEDVDAEPIDRKLKGPIEFKPLAAGEKMTEEERNKASSQLAKSIPNDAESLFNWEIKWDGLPDKVISDTLRPYVEKKVMEALGVQEDLLVSGIERIIREHGSAEDVMRELEETLDEEAEMVTRKVWKMVVFYSESGARGLMI